jgi:toluene monooxygenase system protein E
VKAPPMKTYSHLLGQRRMPSEYEIATSKLHYYVGRGFEVEVPLSAWYQKYQVASALKMDDWDTFRDPRETTYTTYTALHKDAEAHVSGVFRSIAESDYDAMLSGEWVAVLERVLAVARYPFHGLQMVAAYVGQIAPSGRITIACALQAADEMRRVQSFAYRMAQLRVGRPGFGDNAMGAWVADEAWQPMRNYDWAEAFTALNLCAKPLLDELLLVEFGELSRRHGDYLLRELCFSLNEDCKWQRSWSEALVRLARDARADNRRVLSDWASRWVAPCEQAARSLGDAMGRDGAASAERAIENARSFREQLGVGA